MLKKKSANQIVLKIFQILVLCLCDAQFNQNSYVNNIFINLLKNK